MGNAEWIMDIGSGCKSIWNSPAALQYEIIGGAKSCGRLAPFLIAVHLNPSGEHT
jgi:hypothetical protein